MDGFAIHITLNVLEFATHNSRLTIHDSRPLALPQQMPCNWRDLRCAPTCSLPYASGPLTYCDKNAAKMPPTKLATRKIQMEPQDVR